MHFLGHLGKFEPSHTYIYIYNCPAVLQGCPPALPCPARFCHGTGLPLRCWWSTWSGMDLATATPSCVDSVTHTTAWRLRRSLNISVCHSSSCSSSSASSSSCYSSNSSSCIHNNSSSCRYSSHSGSSSSSCNSSCNNNNNSSYSGSSSNDNCSSNNSCNNEWVDRWVDGQTNSLSIRLSAGWTDGRKCRWLLGIVFFK